MKTGRIGAHENLHVCYLTIGKQTVHCLRLESENLLGIVNEKLQREDFLSLKELLDRATVEVFHPKHLTEYLRKPLTDSFNNSQGKIRKFVCHFCG